ncbi:MAG: hypothetical protein JSS98_17980 [Bacteroidetes bacterium]|nr:hypothetical protein [Bacteroidota bacterium]
MPYSIIQIEPRKYILVDDKGNIYNSTPHSKKKCQQQIKAIEANKRSHKDIKGGGAPITPRTPHDMFYVENGYYPLWYFQRILGLNYQEAQHRFHNQAEVLRRIATGHIVDTGDPDDYGAGFKKRNKNSSKKKLKANGGGLTLSKLYHNSWIIPIRVEVCEIFDVMEPHLIHHFPRMPIANYFHEAPQPGIVRVPNEDQQLFTIHFFGDDPQNENILQAPYRLLMTLTNGRRGGLALDNKQVFDDLIAFISHYCVTDPYHPRIRRYEIEQHPPERAVL